MIGPTTVTLDAQDNPITTQEGRIARSETFSLPIVSNSTSLSTALTRLSKSVGDVLGILIGWRRVQAVTFENITVGASGAIVQIHHGLGRRVRWAIVDFAGISTTAGASLVSDMHDASPRTTEDILALRSYVAGTASIEVW